MEQLQKEVLEWLVKTVCVCVCVCVSVYICWVREGKKEKEKLVHI